MGISPAAILYDANGNPVDIVLDNGVRRVAGVNKVLNSSGSQVDPATQGTLEDVKANQESVVDAGNSSTLQLGNGGTFVGTGADCVGFSAIAVTIHSDKDSATDGMSFQFSIDNTNWDDSYNWTLDASASTTRRFQFPVTARYFRINYTNGTQTTTEFRCQTILHRQNILTSIHRLKDNASADRSAQITKSAIIAQRAGGGSTDFIVVEADPGGNLKTVLGDSIPAGTNNIGDVDVVSSALPSGAATEATLATRASEATLSTADGRLATIDSVLDSIKDTDGIKRINDPLPAGTNNIGDVDVVSSALPNGAATEATLATRATAAAQADGTQKTQIVDSTGDGLEVDASGRAAIQNQPNMDVALSTRATEATLLAADGRLTTIDSVLDSIKDTDGIKKITDQLPAGTNEIGKVAQGTKAAAADAWPEYLVDSSGNVVGVVLDGAIYRLQSDSKVAKGSSALVHLDAIDTTSGVGRLKSTLFTQAGDPVSFPSVSESIKNEFVLNGSSSDLLVDGSTTPVVFEYTSDATHLIALQEIRFTIAANSITFGTDYFGSRSGPLANGLLVEVLVESGTVELYNLVQNESFVNFSSPGGFEWVVSSKDMMTSNYVIGGGLSLRPSTTDKVRVTVRDNLSSAGIYFKCFVKGNVAAD